MQIDIQKAYRYYTENIEKSNDKNVLDFNNFSNIFSVWIQTYIKLHMFNSEIEDIPELNIKGDKSRIVNLKVILDKIK